MAPPRSAAFYRVILKSTLRSKSRSVEATSRTGAGNPVTASRWHLLSADRPGDPPRHMRRQRGYERNVGSDIGLLRDSVGGSYAPVCKCNGQQCNQNQQEQRANRKRALHVILSAKFPVNALTKLGHGATLAD
jgi:hypothetical protein